MTRTSIYLDHNATTPILPAVADAMREAQFATPGNAGSQHAAGRAARRMLEDARERIMRLVGANCDGMGADRLVFTSGGTESNNAALRAPFAQTGAGDLVISAIEHPSVEQTARTLADEGIAVDRAPVDRDGVVMVEKLLAMLPPQTTTRPRLVSVMLANNETGVVQPVAEIAGECAERDVLVHTDATQVVGKAPVDFQRLGVAAMTFAAHKFHGPGGIGALVMRQDFPAISLLAGQQGAERPGTAPVALAVGMAAALDVWHDEHAQREARMRSLRDRLERGLLAAYPDAVIVGAGAERLPHTVNIALPGLDRQALVMALDRAAVACSTGSACASGSSEPSPTLLAMGLPDEVVRGSIRLSLGATTTVEEIDEAIARISATFTRFRPAN